MAEGVYTLRGARARQRPGVMTGHYELISTAERLCESAEAAGWRGPDAYDGLWWRWPKPLVGGRRRRQVLMQLHARSPIDIRRLYRRRHPLIPKAIAIYGLTRTRLYDLTGDEAQREAAVATLDALDAERSSGTPGWGYLWDVQTRWSFYRAGEPNVVVTAYGAASLAEAGERLGIARYAERARAAAGWVQDELFDSREGFYAYHPGSRAVIHNASLLGARTVHLHGARADAGDAVARAVERTLEAQQPDGSFPYGEGPGLEFVDSFHTGYVLDCLNDLVDVDPRVGEAVQRGAGYYVERFFGPHGESRLWPDRAFPEDAHAAGTGLSVLAELRGDGLVPEGLLERVADRVVRHGMRGDHAIYRRYRWGTTRVPYLRWADAHVALGLVDAAGASER